MSENRMRIGVEDAEFRASTSDGKKYISGLAIVFNSRSRNLGGFVEVIDERALDSADLSDVVALFNHDPNQVLGRASAGTLKMKKTKRGLEYTIELPDTQLGNDLYTSVSRGDVRGSSFAFSTEPGKVDWSEDPDTGQWVRTVKQIRGVYDVSPVTYPAYLETEAGIGKRALDEHLQSLRLQEQQAEAYKNENEINRLKLLKLK